MTITESDDKQAVERVAQALFVRVWKGGWRAWNVVESDIQTHYRNMALRR